MFHQKTLITLAVLGLILTAGVASSLAFGFKNSGFANQPKLNQEERDARQAKRHAVLAAINKNDFAAWKAAMGNLPSADKLNTVITETNFSRFTEMHKLMQSGDFEGANAIALELGLPQGRGGMGLGIRGGFRGNRFMGMEKFFENGGQFKDNNRDGVCNQLDLEQQ